MCYIHQAAPSVRCQIFATRDICGENAISERGCHFGVGDDINRLSKPNKVNLSEFFELLVKILVKMLSKGSQVSI